MFRMLRRLGIIIVIILVLGFFNFLGTQISKAFPSSGFRTANLAAITASQSGELSSINFDLFAKDGSGWSHVTQGYGHTPYSAWYIGGWHNGIDIAAAYGAPIYSPAAGTVLGAGNQDSFCPGRGFGRFVAVSDPRDDVVLFYAHLGSVLVASGTRIATGTEIATVGTTGFETGTHLHFSVFDEAGFALLPKNGCGPDPTGRDLDPVPYLERF